ncbi:MAG: DUF6377 domain-containing protein [Rikenellaceae bacterium]
MRNILTIIMLLMLPAALFSAEPKRLEELYNSLDAALDSAKYYRAAKEVSISQLKSRINSAQSDEQLQVLNLMLYTEFSKYDSNAAFDLVIDNVERCKKNGEQDNYIVWCLKKAYLYSASGLLKEASDLLSSLRPTISSHDNLLEYYQQMLYLHSHMEQYASGDNRLSPQYLQQKANFTDSVARVIRPSDRGFLSSKAWQHCENDSLAYYRPLLQKSVAQSKNETHDDAIDAYTLAHMYGLEENPDLFIENMILAAIADTRSCNHDIASFHELAVILLSSGDIKRAYSYLSYSLAMSMNYVDRVRMMAVASKMDSTYGLLLAQNRKQSRNLTIFSALLIITLCGLAILFYNWVLKNRKLRHTLKSLDAANSKLDENISQLESVNKELSRAYDEMSCLNKSLVESNYIKESYIGNTFEVCSTHIAKMETIFLKITNLVRNNKLEELKRYCDSSLLLNAEIKILYQAFDYTFLKMYPNFIEELNLLLLEDKQIKLRGENTLSTELRILALNRLGVVDNQKIASILHCSMQTLYNNSQKTKNRTNLSGKELHLELMKIGQ